MADRFHIAKHLTEAVQLLLARVLAELKEAGQASEAPAAIPGEHPVPVEEWRPAPGKQVQQAVATRRAERAGRYQQALTLRSQGRPAQDIAARLGISARTIRHWFHRGEPPDVKPRRKDQSAFDAFAPSVLQRWQAGARTGMQLWREIAAQGYSGSSRMVSRFVETLKTTPVGTASVPVTLPHYASHTAVWLFVRDPQTLDAAEQEDLAAFRQASPTLATTYLLVQDFLQMLRQREGVRLDGWLAQVYATPLPELHSFAHGVEQDKETVRAGLTLPINNGQVEGQVTKIKLIKRSMYGRAAFPLLRQRVLHAL